MHCKVAKSSIVTPINAMSSINSVVKQDSIIVLARAHGADCRTVA